MKKALLSLLFFMSFFSILFSQDCNQLFFSEYIEGWSNNKALEIYNPTGESIDLSAYSVSRYSNGGTTPSTTQLEGSIEAFSTFVVCLDKRNPEGTGYEAPVWDGWYHYTDSITGLPDSIYTEESDLQSRVDLFVNPIYYSGTNPDSAAAYPNSMYFNGNDAVTLELLGTGIVLDLIGKVGEDPGAAWSDSDGNYWTKDHTLRRKFDVLQGADGNPVVFDPTLEWDSLPVNTFSGLGAHDCACNPSNNLSTNSSDFLIYPNPAKNDKIHLSNQHAIKEILIMDQLGKIIAIYFDLEKSHSSIDISNLSSGLYFISMIDDFGVKTKPIVIQNE